MKKQKAIPRTCKACGSIFFDTSACNEHGDFCTVTCRFLEEVRLGLDPKPPATFK